MKKIIFFILFSGSIFGQSIIDTLSVTVYPEFSYPGVAIEYKFDTDSVSQYDFQIPSGIDSVLYTISSNESEFEKIVEINDNTLTTIKQSGNHTIYLFLEKFIKDPGPRDFLYLFESAADVDALIFSFQVPFAAKDFLADAGGIKLEKIRDQNGLTFMQGIDSNYSKFGKKALFFSYYNPHGFTSIQYAANISTENTPLEPPTTASERFIRYPFLTWEPMAIFLLLTLVLVFLYELSNRKEKNN
ncbi:MAG: hypothetical protein HOL62_04305 [Candidatus Marinimicrobia bacterium]|jgi:hypothetical protein|nr:hypothetical protein [Gammaproteobacteria bacterium]MBL6911715.1 hypothetical protein [Candidatus Neomarinimicrobiota bacterium]MBT3728126.1 hypothetical protein [Candidatus Neomarinimicrobiota bacterium]MBT3943856.1 hypothetical protein [Candidatus Neomarinimicrobiota bacterium]MBT4316953.1 hypothetical protein [Candidatus Neomarinimicrobiota bacterium]